MLLFAKMSQINANSNALLFYATPILLSYYHALCDITRDLRYDSWCASPRGGRLLSDFFWWWCTTGTRKTLYYTKRHFATLFLIVWFQKISVPPSRREFHIGPPFPGIFHFQSIFNSPPPPIQTHTPTHSFRNSSNTEYTPNPLW